MYVLTIYQIIDDIDIEIQKVAPDERTLKAAVLSWAQGYGWEADDDEDSTIDEQYEAVIDWLDGGEGDDPRVLIRKADV